MNNKIELGSQTAKRGFRNEKDIADKFNDWTNDKEAQEWLIIMGYKIEEIEKVIATIIHGCKADINVKITIEFKEALGIENIQVKLVSNMNGYNQVDKRWVDTYKEMWNMPDEIVRLFKLYTGEEKPYKKDVRDKRRMFINEFSKEEQEYLLNWITSKKTLIVSDILKGRGEFAAEWWLVAQKVKENSRWTLKNINEVISHYSDGNKVLITDKGNLKIGKITVQRKGGDGGRETAKMLQFKLNPAELFDI
ncbi:MAG TPA: type II restriction endonuclease [Clostridiales bacterium]|nr:type II restriction endonuclease [Clostridiales bacterium]